MAKTKKTTQKKKKADAGGRASAAGKVFKIELEERTGRREKSSLKGNKANRRRKRSRRGSGREKATIEGKKQSSNLKVMAVPGKRTEAGKN